MNLPKKFTSRGRMMIATLLCVGITAMPFIAGAEEKNDYNKDYLEMKSVEEMYLAYHTRINDMFNDALKKTIKGQTDVDVSKDDTEQNEKCENPENIATICLGKRALYEYRGYEEAMTKAKATSDDPNKGIPLFKEKEASKRTDEAYARGGDRNTFIDREIGTDDPNDKGRALISQEAALDFYSEFTGAYKMHEKNEELITALAKYNEKLSELRTQTYLLPPQFHNVTTDGGECT